MGHVDLKGIRLARTGKILASLHGWPDGMPNDDNARIISLLAFIAESLDIHLRRAADDLKRIYAAMPKQKHAKPKRKRKAKRKAKRKGG